MSQIRKALVIACSLASVGGVAHAEDHAVVRRLSTHGKLTSAHAKQVASKVSERMARSADAPPAMIEPLRAAMSQALLGTPMAPDGISAAKVRLKLYAGLSEFALEAIFAPRPGAIASCQRDLELAQKDCEALVAAAGEVSLAQAKRNGSGPAPAPVAMAPVRSAQPQAAMMRGPAPQAPMQGNGSRFGGQQPQQGYPQQQASRFGGAAPVAQQPQRFAGAQQQQGRFGGGAAPAAQPQQQGRFASGGGAPAAQPQPQQASRFGGAAAPQQARFAGNAPVQAAPAAAPAYVAAAPAPQANPAEATARKEEYAAKREAYLARKKQEFEERRAKMLGGPAGAAPAAEPAAEAPAAPSAAPKQAEAKKPAEPVAAAEPEPTNELDAEMKKAVGKEAEKPAPTGSGKAGLDGDFLDGLLDDPTGGNKKK